MAKKNKDVVNMEETSFVAKQAVDEFELKLEAHKRVLISHEGIIYIENMGGGDIHVNDSILYKGDSIEVDSEASLYVTCFPKAKIIKYG